MKAYHEIFPDSRAPVLTLDLGRKTGSIPKGSYRFLGRYCTDPACDCRRVTVIVVNEKQKPKAAICFGFDGEGPFAGPYLDPSQYQSPYAPGLLEYFVASLNSRPDWLTRIYQQYREVRELVEKKPYRGRPFPKPGQIPYHATPPPDLEAVLEQSLKKRSGSGASSAAAAWASGPGRTPRDAAQQDTSGAKGEGSANGMAHFVELYAKGGGTGPVALLLALQGELRHYLLANDSAGEELAALLPSLCQQSPEDDEKIDAALRVLCDTLDFYQVELEGRRPGAKKQMARFQSALLQRVFVENEDVDLSLAVSDILVQSRVQMAPELGAASSRVMASGDGRFDLQDLPGEDVLTGIARSFASLGVSSPFEGAREMFQLFAMNDPDWQTALIGEMMTADNRLLRDISGLMLFHHDPELSLEVSQLLVRVDGRQITPETLRRLIVSRNWFPGEVRRSVDQVITNARKAHVACAPLAKPPAMTVYASPVDGAGAQGFQILAPDAAGFSASSLLLKMGLGVADSFVTSFRSQREVDSFVATLQSGDSYLESSPEYLDLRIGHALADGIGHGSAPNHWLVQIAEILGRDRWKGAPFDAGNELLQLRAEIAARDPRLVEDREYLASLEESARWHLRHAMFASWFEDGESVDRELADLSTGGKDLDAAAVMERLLANVLEKRRAVWLERLVIDTLWLRYAKSPPVPWHRMYHVAQAVADQTLALKEIPLMVAIAKKSLEAYRQRSKSGRRKGGVTA